MRDWFDLNNDGKLDAFEEACKWSHINDCVEKWEKEDKTKNTYKASNYQSGKDETSGWVILFWIIVLLIVDYYLFKLIF